ncbi:MAG: branched-chain amino acid ABC transporter permease/ATP-binding protein [Solirubrobacteraceae bacterium]
MSAVIQYGLLGLGAGAIYALLGQGIVLIYRGSGVLNLAQGAYAMIAAYLYLQLHAPGNFGFGSFSTQTGWPVVPSFLVAVAAAAGLGLATDQLLLRRMRQASPLARLIATVGVLLLLQSIAVKIWGTNPPFVAQILPSRVWNLGGSITVPSGYVWLLLIAVVFTAVLTALWHFTRIGWVTSAVSDNQRGAAAVGISPEFVSSATWAAGSALAGVAGILFTPITQVSPAGVSLLVIPALAAVLLGGFSSFPATLASGVAVGIAQAVLLNYNSFFQQHLKVTSMSDALPLFVIVAVMIVRGSSLPLRGEISDRLPAIGIGRIRWPVVLPVVAVVLALIFAVFSQNVLAALAVTFSVSTLLLSIVVLTGYAGQISLAQYTLAGIGGVIGAELAAHAGFAFLPALLSGMVGAMLIGLLLAIPALRTRGVSLAIITLGLAWAAQDMIFTNPSVGGADVGINVGSASLFGLDVSGAGHPDRYAALTFVVFVICAALVANLRRGGLGRRMIAVRSNERAASASGIGVFRTKMIAFALSGALAGLAGILFSFEYQSAVFTSFDPSFSLLALAWIVIGGIGFVFGTFNGAIVAPGALLSLIGLHWEGFTTWLPIIGAVGALAAVRFNANGIAHQQVRDVARLRARFAPRRRGHAPGDLELPAAVDPVRVPPRRLRIEGLTVRYGGVVAVDGVNLEAGPGEIVGLIGPNGAGKTSLMDAVSGFARYSGRVLLDDEPIDRWPSHRRSVAGLVRSFQGLELFSELTVLENLQVPHDRIGGWGTAGELVRPVRTTLPPVTVAAVREFGLESVLDMLPDEISYGQRRLVAIARAVAAEPSVLLLDEPVAGLSEHESAEFARLVRRLADVWGMAVLVIEHDLNFVMSICDRITVIDFGRPVCDGAPEEVRGDPAAIAVYLGEETAAPSVASVNAPPVTW